MISGVHFNFSISDGFLEEMRTAYPKIPRDKDEAYLRCIRGLFQTAVCFQSFFDASPINLDGKIIETDSFRNSGEGYRNNPDVQVDFSSKASYIKSVDSLIADKRIKEFRELYTPIRAKFSEILPPTKSLRQFKIDHIEMRLTDINPFDICGISREEISLATAFMFYCMIFGDDVSTDIESILAVCEKTDSRFQLGLTEGIAFAKRYLTGTETKAVHIRRLLRENPCAMMNIAKTYTQEII